MNDPGAQLLSNDFHKMLYAAKAGGIVADRLIRATFHRVIECGVSDLKPCSSRLVRIALQEAKHHVA